MVATMVIAAAKVEVAAPAVASNGAIGVVTAVVLPAVPILGPGEPMSVEAPCYHLIPVPCV